MDLHSSPFAVSLLRLCLRNTQTNQVVAKAVGLPVREWQCLSWIALENPCCVSKLTSLMGVRASSTSKTLQKIESLGLISRALDVSDHRVERIALTTEGEVTVRRILAEFARLTENGTFQDSSKEQVLREESLNHLVSYLLNLTPLTGHSGRTL